MKIIHLYIFAFILVLNLHAHSKSVEAFTSNKVFYAPEVGSYIETDILIAGPSIKYVINDNGQYQGAVQVSLIFKKDNEIVAFDKYLLLSVEVADTNAVNLSIIDKKRFPLPDGIYTFEASFKDINGNSEEYRITESLIIDMETDKVCISDISLVDTYDISKADNIYTRNGYYMTPYVLNYFPENINKLIFFAEIYNPDKAANTEYVATYSIRKSKSDEVSGNLGKHVILSPIPVNMIFSEFDISFLPTGNYNLVLEVRDKTNNLLKVKKLFFQRNKPIKPVSLQDLSALMIENTFVEPYSSEALIYYLKAVSPVANAGEYKTINNYIRDPNLIEMKRFFLNFWTTRDPAAPLAAWELYQTEVNKVNSKFSTTLEYGFETERGRIYLQYGAPNQILEAVREPGALPYEIWTYYAISNGQKNVKFVFYNPDLVSNNYIMIHSTANGEIRNPNWQKLVHEPFVGGNTPIDQGTRIREHFGSKISDIYDE